MTYHSLIFGLNNTTSNSLANAIVTRSSGAHRIATFLREHEWDVEVIDFTAYWSLDELKELVKSRVTSKTVFFGFSTMFSQWPTSMDLFTAWLKQTYPHIKIVLGGNSVASAPASNIDYWIDGYGEMAILELAKNLTNHSSKPLAFDAKHFGSKKLIQSLHSYPAFPLTSYKKTYEARDFIQPYEWGNIEFSRGCRFSCKFCSFPILGVKEDYTITQKNLELELKHNYENFGIKHYYVTDETFNDSKDKIIKYADVIERLNFRPFFSGFIRLDLLVTQPAMMKHLARMNFGGQHYGVESFNHASVKAIGKGMHPERIKAGLLKAKEFFTNSGMDMYRGHATFIIGLPYETEQSVKDTTDWIVKNYLDQSASVNPLYITDMEVSPGDTNISDFTRNLSKHGLRKMPEPVIFPAHQFPIGISRNNIHGLTWEHDTMNIVDAYRITNDVRDRTMPSVKMDNWKLHLPFFVAGQRDLNFKEIEQYRKRDWVNVDIGSVNKFVQQYIAQKLSV